MTVCRTHTQRILMVVLALGFMWPAAITSTARAEEQIGGAPGDWLSRYTNARTSGLGSAFVAAADQPMGVLWNPAGLSLLFQNEVHLETARLFEETSYHGFSFAMPATRFPSFGVTVVALRSGDFERTNELNQPLGTFKEADIAFLLTASKNLGRRLSLGTNIKVVRQAVDEFDGTGVGADFGLLFDVTPMLRIGASLMNVGGPSVKLRSTEETYPIEFRGGVALTVLSGRGLITAEFDRRTADDMSFHGGSEFWVHHLLALRIGYDDDSPSGGFSYRIAPDMRLDYGISDHELGITHRIGFSYRFGGFFANSEATPNVFSPIGEQSVTKIHLQARSKADIRSWILEILDKSSQVVRRFGGKGAPPAHVMWDGKAESGLQLPDGVYRYRFQVVDEDGRVIEGHERTVEITTTGPQGSVPVIIQ